MVDDENYTIDKEFLEKADLQDQGNVFQSFHTMVQGKLMFLQSKVD